MVMKSKLIVFLVIFGILGSSLAAIAPVEVGKRYDVTIEDIARQGDGIARVEGFIIFVPDTQIGDEVTIQIDSVVRRFAVGHKVESNEAFGGNSNGNAPSSAKIYVIGHKSPDADSVISAIAYANLKNYMSPKETVPAVAGDLNQETVFVLDYF